MHQLIPDSAFILVNKSKQPLYSRNSFERGLSKTLKKLTIFFLSNPVPFNGQSYQKQKGPGTSDQLYFKLQNKYIKISLLVTYYLTKVDGINIIPRTILCKPIHEINYSTSICPVKCGKKGEKFQNLNILRTKRVF